tara:strand:+ start:2734 stop:3174 length:441 start_codon:yes stop_codon:yes gene_type:complete
MILNEIKNDLKHAMKDKDKDKVLAMRNILEKIKKIQVDSKTELNENEIIRIISKYAKQLKDSIEQFKSGNRMDLAEKEEKELKVVEKFLPQQLSKDEVIKIVNDVITELNASNMSDMGMVMKKVMDLTSGSADGKLISTITREALK